MVIFNSYVKLYTRGYHMIHIENPMKSCGTQLIWHSDVRTAAQPPVAPSATGGGRRGEGEGRRVSTQKNTVCIVGCLPIMVYIVGFCLYI
jgi:hypothetical protein